MNSRERIQATLSHTVPDKIPLDLGASPTTGMHVSSVYLLRQALRLDPPGTPVKVIEPYQMLGEIADDLISVLEIDVLPLSGRLNMFGFKNENWKTWQLFDGTPVVVPEKFNTIPEANGDILMYPEGDRSAPASGRMPMGGFYFDAIVRQPPIVEGNLNPKDNLEEFVSVTEDDLLWYASESERLCTHTDKAILANFGGTGFGDIGLVPAVQLKDPKGIRDIAEWYMATISHKDYVWQVFEKQCAIAIENLKQIHAVVKDRVTIIFVSGTDFGTQTGLFISPRTYQNLYQPFHKEVNTWIHENTNWKTFIHSCGGVYKLIPYFIESGFDILNPVQTSAKGMDITQLKANFGNNLTFWGGGVDTQKILPYGTPEDVEKDVADRMRIFGEGGGFVFNPIHNVQAGIPVENLVALYHAVKKYRTIYG
jgi:hypothetical protein